MASELDGEIDTQFELRSLVRQNTPKETTYASKKVRTMEEINDVSRLIPPAINFGNVPQDTINYDTPSFDDSYSISKSEAWNNVFEGIKSVYMPNETTLEGLSDAFNATGVNINELAYNYENGINPQADPQFNLEARLEAMGISPLREFFEGGWNAPRVVNENQFEVRLKHIVNAQEKRMRMAKSPETFFFGQMAGYLIAPEAWVALATKAGVSTLVQTAKAGGLAATRTFPQIDETGNASGALTETLVIAGTQYVLSGVFNKFYKMKKRNGEEITAEDAAGHHIISEKVIKEGKASEPASGIDSLKTTVQSKWATGSSETTIETAKKSTASADDTKSVGAMVNEDSLPKPVTIAEELIQNSVEKTWALGDMLSPISRILSGIDNDAKTLLLNIFEVVPKLRKNTKEFDFQPTEQALETKIKTKYRADIGELHSNIFGQYNAMLKRMNVNPLRRAGGVLGLSQNKIPTILEFRQRVTQVQRSKQKSGIPEIDNAAAHVNKIISKYTDEIIESNIINDKRAREIAKLQASYKNALPDLKQYIAAQIEKLTKEMKEANDGLRAVSDGFLPRMWRKDKIEGNFDEFVKRIQNAGRLSKKEAVKIARQLRDYNPFVAAAEGSTTGVARSLHARELDFIKDIDFEDFLENDVLTIMTTYMRGVAPDLELYKKFGSVDLELNDLINGGVGPITRVANNFDKKIAEATNEAARKKLLKQKNDTLEDLRAMRDLLRGTYMMPSDPSSGVSKAIRIAKNFSAMTMLTGAMAAAPDIARVVTANGLRNSFGSLFEALTNNQVWKSGLAQNRSIGESYEFWLSSRAAQIADVGDTFGLHNRFESVTGNLASFNFMINGMSFWNDFVKTSTGIVVGTKILQDAKAVAAGKASVKQKERLAKSGIGQAEAESIVAMSDNWQVTDANIIANSSKWDNLIAKDAFENALSKEINTIIVTPGLGERPLFMSNQYLSLLTQFKSFAMSSHQRVLVPALQDADRNVVTQLALMTAVGMGIEQIRNAQNGAPDQTWNEMLIGGIGRAGWTGWFLDADNYASNATGGSLSIQSMLGARENHGDFASLEYMLGPSFKAASTAASFAGDVLTGNVDASKARDLMPYNRIAHLDWIFSSLEDGTE